MDSSFSFVKGKQNDFFKRKIPYSSNPMKKTQNQQHVRSSTQYFPPSPPCLWHPTEDINPYKCSKQLLDTVVLSANITQTGLNSAFSSCGLIHILYSGKVFPLAGWLLLVRLSQNKLWCVEHAIQCVTVWFTDKSVELIT